MKTRAKLSSRNNLLRKLHGTNWGACPHTMRTTATALCLSVAEYCCPVWARSTHRKLVDATLNETCRLITGCIRPTATPDLYVLSGIAPPEIRRSVHSQNERTKQLTDQRHSLRHHQPVKSRLHSRNSFVSTSQPLLCKPAEARIAKWQEQWEQTDSNLKRYNIDPKERLPSGHTLPWRAWRTSNRVRSGQAATPAAKHLWGYRRVPVVIQTVACNRWPINDNNLRVTIILHAILCILSLHHNRRPNPAICLFQSLIILCQIKLSR